MNKETFIEEVEKLGIEINQDKLDKIDYFYKLLIEWNEKINLTTIIKEEEVYLKHFYDSLTTSMVYDLTKDISFCDVGTGAGFPGIVLKIFFPNLKIVLIDSLNKRITYLNDVISKLELKDIVAKHARMEEYSRINKEEFDVIIARAVASTQILAEISVASLKINGSLILMKANAEDEISLSKGAFEKLGLVVKYTKNFLLPCENSNRMLIVLEKIAKTNKLYPRNMGKIRRIPL